MATGGQTDVFWNVEPAETCQRGTRITMALRPRNVGSSRSVQKKPREISYLKGIEIDGKW
jgi:hypothetical protein